MESRYRVVEILGRGGMGEVCLAEDVMLDRQVALKFVSDRAITGGLEQLLNEARAAAALDHPFICSIYEVTTIDGRPCIAMEYVRGESLDRRLRGGRLALEQALRISEEIAEALDAAHRRRVVHRDLKPANVMLTEDDHIKVMDFGLAARLSRADDGHTRVIDADALGNAVRGTPAYMAPEQIRGEPADRRSDIFSFGILLYELISGTNPFVRSGLDATLAAILKEQAPPIRRRLPSAPAAVDAFLSELLAKDPSMRPQSFSDVRAALRRISAQSVPLQVAPAAVVDSTHADGAATFIGRETELAQLLNGAGQARSGRGGVVMLFGEGGTGKSRLAEEALTAARRLGCQTLVGRCSSQDDTPAMLPFIELLEEAGRLIPPGIFQQAVKPGAAELARLMPELHQMFPDMAAPLELPQALQRRYLFANIREFLTRIAQSMPLVILLDDLQWADDLTLQCLQHLAQGLPTLPIFIIGAYRDSDGPSTPAEKGRLYSLLDRVRGQREAFAPQAVRAALDDLVDQRLARAHVLRPFTEPEVRNALGTLGPPNPPAKVVRTFIEHTGGNPFFVVELFRHLKEDGKLLKAGLQWTRDVDFDEVPLPDTLRRVLERRIQRVSIETQTVLRAAAVLGRQFELDVLEEVAEVSNDVLIAALEEAEQARIVLGPSGRREMAWRFVHQLVCQTLTAAIPPLRRQRLHLRAAGSLAKLNRDSRAGAAGVAHHLYCAGSLADPERTAHALIEAGDGARAMYATDEAIRHYRRALDVLQDTKLDDAKRTVREHLGDLLGLLGDRAAAMQQYDEASACYRPVSTVDRARLARKIGALHWQAGQRADAMAAYERALENLSDGDAHLEVAHLLQELGIAAFRSGDNQKAIEWAERALQSAEYALAETGENNFSRRNAMAAIAHATNTIGVAMARSGQLDAARERIERSLATAHELNLLEVACRAYANLGVLYSSVEPRRAIDASLNGLDIASKIGAASLQPYLYANLATAYCALTDRCESEGLEAARTAAALDRELGQLDHLAVPLVVMAQIHQCRGELQKAHDTYREALALAEGINEPQLILPCYDGLATIHLDRGDRASAEKYMEKARELCERAGLDPDSLLLLPFLC